MIKTNKDSIEVEGMMCSNWGHVKWIIMALTQNAELIWGPDVVKKPSATVLTLVNPSKETKDATLINNGGIK